MRRVLLLCSIGLVVLLASCQQNDLASPTPTVTSMQLTEAPEGIPTQRAELTATHQDELKPDEEHFIFVTAIQDRPNEMPELQPREDGFSQTEPWAIAPAFVPADGMRFIALEVTALNLSETSWQFNGSKLVLSDETGRGYPAQLGCTYLGLMPFKLHYGQKAQGWVVFEIPEDAFAKEIMVPTDEKHWIVSPIDAAILRPDAAPRLTTSTNASASNLTLNLIAIKDPGTPFSTFAYTYITGYRPVNIMVEIINLTDEEIAFRPHQFVLMDENGVLHFNQPGGASESFNGEDLQPNETRRGEVSFDLPEGAEPRQLFYLVASYTDEYLQISVQP